MKVFKTVAAVIIAFFMSAYMICAASLWAIDMSFDEKNIQNVLNNSDLLAEMIRTAELRINNELEENAENIVEDFGGDLTDTDISEMYRLPEVTALFADVFTNSARAVLYDEEYTEVDEELVREYLYAVVDYSIGRKASESELEEYLAGSLEIYTQRFNDTIGNMTAAFSAENEALDTVRFLYNDMKIFATVAAIAHMLVLVLIIKGKMGYFANAAVFGTSGITMLAASASMQKILGAGTSSMYNQMLAQIFRNRFAFLGAILFAIFAALMVTAVALSIRRIPAEK